GGWLIFFIIWTFLAVQDYAGTLQIEYGLEGLVGPEYAGPLGILQALADGTKLLFKENLLPSRGDTRLFSIGPSIAVISISLSYSYWFFLWIAISSLAPVGLLISGYASNNKYSFLGELRAAAQSISYEIPLTLCLLVGMVIQHKAMERWGWKLFRETAKR
ncbi:hypothetical protein MIMGU_mgv1a020581mg, partial [Erythranthe guttata]